MSRRWTDSWSCWFSKRIRVCGCTSSPLVGSKRPKKAVLKITNNRLNNQGKNWQSIFTLLHGPYARSQDAREDRLWWPWPTPTVHCGPEALRNDCQVLSNVYLTAQNALKKKDKLESHRYAPFLFRVQLVYRITLASSWATLTKSSKNSRGSAVLSGNSTWAKRTMMSQDRSIAHCSMLANEWINAIRLALTVVIETQVEKKMISKQ